MQRFPSWKYGLLLLSLVLGFLYALPNIYGEEPILQVSLLSGPGAGRSIENAAEPAVEMAAVQKISEVLQAANLGYRSITEQVPKLWIIRFEDPAQQLQAQALLQKGLGSSFNVALNLAALTPAWLDAMAAKPMKLGLDLRGGVHFLMEVALDPVLQSAPSEAETLSPSGPGIADSVPTPTPTPKTARLPEEKEMLRRAILDQTLNTLRKRVNELGVAEALVQRQGLNRIVVELPGIQDTAYARRILGKTATLKFLMEDHKHSLERVLSGHFVAGSKVYRDPAGRPVLLHTQPILTGESIVTASSGQDRDGRAAVNIRLGGDTQLFSKTTLRELGHRMAVLYIEMTDQGLRESVISLATIQSPLANQFQITGLSFEESKELALLLRSGALPAPVSIVEESIVGPSMGQDNIRMGLISVSVGLGLVLFFMMLYYSVFGIIANIALLANLVLLVALLSIMGATLTLPGIAGIVLTLGMAVDANVLIFERIREELRAGSNARASIQRGFEGAFATILDSNLTTLIVGIILFSMGSGPIKGFAITLCVGILTSLFTAVTGSRALIECLYRGRTIQKLRVGI